MVAATASYILKQQFSCVSFVMKTQGQHGNEAGKRAWECGLGEGLGMRLGRESGNEAGKRAWECGLGMRLGRWAEYEAGNWAQK